jgi:RNA polymerase sigma-70 factor (ECF subfamily)
MTSVQKAIETGSGPVATNDSRPSVAEGPPLTPSAGPMPAVSPGRLAKTTQPQPEVGPDVEGEIALLSEAQRALSGGQPEKALQFLDEHARVFPHGALAEERTAARIVALCKLGRVVRARNEATAFLQRLPDSPLAERVRAACGDAVAPKTP